MTVLDLIPLASGSAINSIIATVNAINSSSLAQSTAFVATPTSPQQDVLGGGHWSRIIAGTDEVNADTAVTASVRGAPIGANSCESTTRLNYIGTQSGVDIGKFKFNNGANVQWGFTAGYVEADAKDKTPNVGTFSSDNQVAFAGLYLALNKGNFSFDGQIRGDYYNMSLNDVDNSLFQQPLNARGMAALANASYRFDMANNWFIEPSIGGVLSQTDVNPLDVAGALDLPGSVTPSTTLPGTVRVGSITSAMARASLRVGTTIVTPTMAWQPFGTVSIFHEFADDVITNVSTGPPSILLGGTIPLSATATTSRVGTFGHVGVGIAGLVLDTGWLGYIKADYRFGDNIDALSINAGLRYQFEAAKFANGSMKDGGQAFDSYNWTGLYVGMNSGGLSGQQDWVFPGGTGVVHSDFRGAMAGGQVGYDHQFGHVVVGVEADYNWTNAEGGSSCPNQLNIFSCTARMESIGFVTARLGFALGRALYYAKGGLAFGEVGSGAQNNHGGLSLLYSFNELFNPSATQTGWAYGGGMEFAIDDRWSARGEILHFDLGKENFILQAPNIGAEVETTGTIARVGVNYRFGSRGHDYHQDALK